MKKAFTSKLCLASLAFVTLSLTSCAEKDLYGPKNDETPSLATFATTQDVQFSMQYNVPTGYAAGFDVYAENPIEAAENGMIVLRTDIQPIAAGIAESGLFNLKKRIPGYVTELYAFSSDLFAPKLMYAKIQNGTANFQSIGLGSQSDTKATTRTTATEKINVADGDFIPTMDDKHTPASEGNLNVSDNVLKAISKAFPESWKGIPVPEAYLKEATMELKEKAELWIAPLMTGCSMTNTLGYFCYDGPKSDLVGKSIKDLDEKLIVVFPFASLADNAFLKDQTNLQRGDKFRLKYYDKTKQALVNEFPKGTTVVWFLWAGAYDKNTKTWKDKTNHKLYSNWEWNTAETDPTRKPHTAYYSIRYENTDYVCFAFEDQVNAHNDRDFNDMVFMMQANPAAAIVPPVVIDGDGKEVETQTEDRKGILAFEDNWPWEGDYDLNDVVVKYDSESTYTNESNSTYVSKTADAFTLIHSGAGFHNSFSIKYDIAPSAVSSITVNGASVSYRADGSGYVIDICPDVLSKIEAYADNQSYTYTVVTEFNKNAVSQAGFQDKVAPYNPYISPSAGIEVHLPMYEPTAGVDSRYFGTRDDCSDPAKKIYYVGKENSQYPWAIHLSGVETFSTTEKHPINETYPRFTDWVQSNFQSYQDWYLNK